MRQTHQIGLVAEWLCISRLILTGWQISNLRWRCPSGEIDIVARRGQVISFIEVKARNSHDNALYAISATQQQRIRQAASLWLAKHPKYAGDDCRFDVMSVSKWPVPKRHVNVF